MKRLASFSLLLVLGSTAGVTQTGDAKVCAEGRGNSVDSVRMASSHQANTQDSSLHNYALAAP